MTQKKKSRLPAGRGPLAPNNAKFKINKASSKNKQPAHPQHHQPSQSAPMTPFLPSSHLLLVGEGDFSFSSSLLAHHPDKFTHLLATSYESPESLAEKHPQTAKYLEELDDDAACEVAYNVDATKLHSYKFIANHQTEGDARGWDWIVFNFPHVGGLSTDVRRQVRANQELLVKFFESCRRIMRQPKWQLESWEEGDSPEETEMRRTGGRVLVTLFEGEPYTLWNVKDLARHADLVVERSWKFQAAAFPGYQHARTLGNLRGGGGSGGSKAEGIQAEGTKPEAGEEPPEGKAKPDAEPRKDAEEKKEDKDHEGYVKHVRPGAWRGEERPARSYVFRLPMPEKPRKDKTRAKKAADDDSDDE